MNTISNPTHKQGCSCVKAAFLPGSSQMTTSPCALIQQCMAELLTAGTKVADKFCQLIQRDTAAQLQRLLVLLYLQHHSSKSTPYQGEVALTTAISAPHNGIAYHLSKPHEPQAMAASPSCLHRLWKQLRHLHIVLQYCQVLLGGNKMLQEPCCSCQVISFSVGCQLC